MYSYVHLQLATLMGIKMFKRNRKRKTETKLKLQTDISNVKTFKFQTSFS